MTHRDARRTTLSGVIEPPVGIRHLDDVEPAHRRIHGSTRSGDGIAEGDRRRRIWRPNWGGHVRTAAAAGGHEGKECRMRHEPEGLGPRQAKHGVWMAEDESINRIRHFLMLCPKDRVHISRFVEGGGSASVRFPPHAAKGLYGRSLRLWSASWPSMAAPFDPQFLDGRRVRDSNATAGRRRSRSCASWRRDRRDCGGVQRRLRGSVPPGLSSLAANRNRGPPA